MARELGGFHCFRDDERKASGHAATARAPKVPAVAPAAPIGTVVLTL